MIALAFIATAGTVEAQTRFNQEITIYVDADTRLRIRDGSGEVLHTTVIQNTSGTGWKWIGDLNGDPHDPQSNSNCRICDWGLDWENASTDVLYFVFSHPMTDQVTAYYAYSPQTARLYESFWTPSDLGDSHDISFYVDAQRNVTASTAGPSETFESVFSDKYVWPYDAEVYCVAHTPSHCAPPHRGGLLPCPHGLCPG